MGQAEQSLSFCRLGQEEHEPEKGRWVSLQDRFDTTKLQPIQESGNEAQDILMYVYDALAAKGYDPITQMVGYIISGDPTYITSFHSARSLICRLERDEILEEIVRFYVKGHMA